MAMCICLFLGMLFPNTSASISEPGSIFSSLKLNSALANLVSEMSAKYNWRSLGSVPGKLLGFAARMASFRK
jgi:hypothetical protein